MFSDLKSRIFIHPSVRQRFSKIKDFRGLSYESIVQRTKFMANRTHLRDCGQTARTWTDGNYSITLLFNDAGLCLGVEEERIDNKV